MDCTACVKERISEFLAKNLRNGLNSPDQANLIMEQAGLQMTGRETDCGGKITMGKGDKRTRRGKIWRGTYGKRRPKPRKSRKEAKKK